MKKILAYGVGRRKEAIAQVQIIEGTGQFLVNNIPVQQYLHNNTCSILLVQAPLNVLLSVNNNEVILEQNKTDNSIKNNSFSEFDTIVKVKGGGLVGQAEAIKLGLARALCSFNLESNNIATQDDVRKQLKDKGYLTQDSRVKERRKYGLKKARKATQYNKR
jgi:small subunit ribosomal protein S9